jgi:hypothetical protein
VPRHFPSHFTLDSFLQALETPFRDLEYPENAVDVEDTFAGIVKEDLQ